MPVTLAPNQNDVQVALRGFLIDVLPAGTEVIEGQDNRVPEPSAGNFVVMWPVRRPRLGTNVADYVDAAYRASIALDVMTVTQILLGEVKPGASLFGPGVTAGTTVVSQLTGSPLGGVGTYLVSASQAVALATLASGRVDVTQPTEIRMRLDVHGSAASDNAQIISTLLRSGYAVEKFSELAPGVAPLYSEDPQQLPFLNAETQIEYRWTVEAVLQANQVVTIPQQFAGELEAGLINVDAVYPPA